MKFLMAFLLLSCPMSVSYEKNTSLSVVTNYAYVYEMPSFTSNKLDLEIKKNEIVVLLDATQHNGFYFVSYNSGEKNYEGYVYKECLAKLEREQELVLTYNAKTSMKTKVFSLSDKSEIVTIEEGTELDLYEGFDRKNEFTKAKFSHNGQIIFGYIKTEDISPYGVSPVLIIALTAIFACVGVIFILLGINKKKLRKPVVDLEEMLK